MDLFSWFSLENFNFRFENPLQFYWLIVWVACIFGFKKARDFKNTALSKLTIRGSDFYAQNSNCSRRDRLILAALFLVIVALARPQWGHNSQKIDAKGLDIVLMQDVSTSMLAEDIQPNRLIRSKHEISQFLSQMSNDRIALIGFAQEARLTVPLTLDYAAVMNQLEILDPAEYTQGTNATQAFKLALSHTDSASGPFQVFILMTDGEDQEPGIEEMVQKAAQRGITVYTIGIGSTQGVKIPLTENGIKTFKKDQNGQEVVTKLNAEALHKIAALGNGRYYEANGNRFELERILKDIQHRARRKVESHTSQIYTDRYEWPLGLAIAFLMIECILGYAVRNSKKGKE